MKRKEITFYPFILMVAMLMAVVSLPINMLLPAFEDIATDFNIKEKNRIQLSISLLYLGLGVSQLIYGPVSDSIGRKPAIQFGLMLFLVGCIISLCADNLFILIVGQIFQGLGLGAPRALSIALIRDRFSGNEMARAISFIMIIYVFTPIISPALGKSIIINYHWRSVFLSFILFAGGLLLAFRLRMPETLAPDRKRALSLNYVISAVKEVLNQRKSLGYVTILGIYSGMFIAYMNLSQSVFEFQYGLGGQYPLYFAVLASSIGLASFLNGKMVLNTKMTNIVKFVIITETLLSAFFLISYNLGHQSLSWFITFMFIQLMGYGFLIGNLNALAMQPLGHIAGLGAAVVGAVSTIIAVPIAIMVGNLYQNTSLPLLWGFFIAGIVSIILYCVINT